MILAFIVILLGFNARGQEGTPINVIKRLKYFLEFDFQDNYTILESNSSFMHGDAGVSISIPDETFEEIELFLRNINLDKEEIQFSTDKKEKYIQVWYKNIDMDKFGQTYHGHGSCIYLDKEGKIHFFSDRIVRNNEKDIFCKVFVVAMGEYACFSRILCVDCDKKIIYYNETNY